MNSYKQVKIIDKPSKNCTIIEVRKANRTYMMYKFQNSQLTKIENYNLTITKNIAAKHYSHMLAIIEEFNHQNNHYIIYQSYQKDLLNTQLQQHNQVFTIPNALEYIARIFDNLSQLHGQRYVYRNILPQKIYLKNYQPFFHDFSRCKFMSRNQRLFDIVGNAKYLAPQVFGQDGYGKQLDIWAVGVLLFYMLTKQYPFNFPQNPTTLETEYRKQVQNLCKNGFDIDTAIAKTKNPGKIKPNKHMKDFFMKIFKLDYTQRISIPDIKKHPFFKGFFKNQTNSFMLEQIVQSGNSSIFLSYAPKFQQSYQFHKQQIVLDFIQRSSQSIDLDCTDVIDEQLRAKTKFAILKIGMMRLKQFQDVIFGLKKPDFKIDQAQWQKIKSSTYFQLIKQKLEKQRKIMEVYYKSTLLDIKNKDQFFDLSIPTDFNSIKGYYRNIISSMFNAVKKTIVQNKGHRKLARKMTQTLVRLTIMHLINRIFEQENLHYNFSLYFNWPKNPSNTLQNLDFWISDEKIVNLKNFMKLITCRYL